MSKTPEQRRTIRVILKLLLGMMAIVVLFGVAAVGMGGVAVYRGLVAQSWPTAAGVVAAADVMREFTPDAESDGTSAPGSTTYTPRIQYRYTVDDREYIGERVEFIDAATSNPERAAVLAMRYPAGKRVEVHYDPRAPQRAVLQPGASRNSLLLVLAGVCFIVVPVFAFGIPLWRALKRHADDAPDARQDAAPAGALPSTRNVQVLEDSRDRLVIALPPGRTGVETTGWIAAIMLGLGGFFAAFFLPDMLDQYARPSTTEYIVAAAFGLATLGGLAMLAWWFKLKYTHYKLAVTRSQAVIERRLFAFAKRTAVTFAMDTRAQLVVDHEDMDEPIDAITFAPAGAHVRFGVTLSPHEKQWVVDRVNAFLNAIS